MSFGRLGSLGRGYGRMGGGGIVANDPSPPTGRRYTGMLLTITLPAA